MVAHCSNVSLNESFSCRMSDPGKPADFIVLALVTVACIPFIAGNILLLIHRNYFPIKVKGVDLILASSVGGFIWLVASFVVNNHFGRTGVLLDVCPLWTFWMQLCFGVSLWLNCFNVRLLNLYLIFRCKRDPISPIWLPLGLLQSPMIIFSIFATAFHACSYVCAPDASSMNTLADCKINGPGWSLGTLVVLAFYFVLMVSLGIKLRNIMAPYNEYRLIREGAFILFFLAGVAIQRCIRFEVAGRAFLTLTVAYVVFYYFWMRNGLVVYKVLFHKAAYEKEFKEKFQEAMNKPTLVDERGFSVELPASSIAREEIVSHTMDFSSTFNADVEAIVRTSRQDVYRYKELIEQQKECIRQLREQVALLEGGDDTAIHRDDGGIGRDSGKVGDEIVTRGLSGPFASRRVRTYDDTLSVDDLSGGFWRFGRKQSRGARIGRSGPIEKSAPLLRDGIDRSGPIPPGKTPRYATVDWCVDTNQAKTENPMNVRKESSRDGRDVSGGRDPGGGGGGGSGPFLGGGGGSGVISGGGASASVIGGGGGSAGSGPLVAGGSSVGSGSGLGPGRDGMVSVPRTHSASTTPSRAPGGGGGGGSGGSGLLTHDRVVGVIPPPPSREGREIQRTSSMGAAGSRDLSPWGTPSPGAASGRDGSVSQPRSTAPDANFL